jgi:hypothetical protein
VPVVAAALADGGVRYPREAVALRLEQHLLAQATGLLLLASALIERLAGSRGASREGVACLLELGEALQCGSPAARAGGADWDGRGPGREHEPGQLVLEPRYLVAQRAPSGGLVDGRGAKGVRLHRRGHLNRRSAHSG